MHDDPVPLLGEPRVAIRIIASDASRPSLEVNEGVPNGILVASIGVLTIEHGFISMDADPLLTVGEDAKPPQRGIREVSHHPVEDALAEVRPVSLARSRTLPIRARMDISRRGLKKSCAGLVEMPQQSGMVRSRGVPTDQEGATTGTLGVLPGEPSSCRVVRIHDDAHALVLRALRAHQSNVVCKASTAPMHAKVMSTTSQFWKQSSPNRDA